MLKQGSKTVDTIFIHCSATRPEWMEDQSFDDRVAELTRWHKAKGWQTVGYHWIIDRDGSVAKGREETTQGAHVEGHNKGTIGICLLGGHGSSENDQFSKHFTPEQDAALRELIESIKERTPIKAIRGHNEVAAKACPGFNVGRWFDSRPPKTLMESTTMRASATQLLSGGAGGVTAIAALDGYAQIVAVIVCGIIILAAGWIMRERITKWARENAS